MKSSKVYNNVLPSDVGHINIALICDIPNMLLKSFSGIQHIIVSYITKWCTRINHRQTVQYFE